MDLNKSNIKKIMLMVCGSVLFTYMVFNFNTVVRLLRFCLDLLMPFIIGFCIAFVINVPMKAMENLIFKNKDGKLYKLRRPISMILAVILIVVIVSFVVTLVMPEVTKTILAVTASLPDMFARIQEKAINLFKDHEDWVNRISSININWDKVSDSVMNVVKNGGSSLLITTFSFASSVIGTLIDIVVGIFFAFYILAQKENLEKQCRGIVYSLMKEVNADKVLRVFAMADQTFTNFIAGQCLEACILGLMFFVTMSILSIPYALTVSVTISLTALIPVFGSFMGCGIGVFLILVDNPEKVIMFLVLFIILQQIEGNFIYPHVVGGSVGLPSIWVLVAVVLGGDLMGVVGMLIFVPLTSVLYAIVREFVKSKVKEKQIPWRKYSLDCDIPEKYWHGKKKKNKRTAVENALNPDGKGEFLSESEDDSVSDKPAADDKK